MEMSLSYVGTLAGNRKPQAPRLKGSEALPNKVINNWIFLGKAAKLD